MDAMAINQIRASIEPSPRASARSTIGFSAGRARWPRHGCSGRSATPAPISMGFGRGSASIHQSRPDPEVARAAASGSPGRRRRRSQDAPRRADQKRPRRARRARSALRRGRAAHARPAQRSSTPGVVAAVAEVERLLQASMCASRSKIRRRLTRDGAWRSTSPSCRPASRPASTRRAASRGRARADTAGRRLLHRPAARTAGRMRRTGFTAANLPS